MYNRVTRGEHVFGDDQEALELVDIFRDVRDRDGLVVLAWCIMSNHYHLAVRCTSSPLWRSMASIHTRFSKSHNRRYRQYGPFWQGRYKAKLVETPEYLRQLLLYVHLNPISAGIVEKPGEYLWSGHREVIRKIKNPLVNVDQLLLAFDETRRSARGLYLASIRTAQEEPWAEGEPGALPWWRLGRPTGTEPDEDLRLDPSMPFVDEVGRTTSPERPELRAGEFIERALSALEIGRHEVSGRTKRREVVRAREILMTIGVELYGLRVKDLAAELGVVYDTASLWGRRGARRRVEDRGFAGKVDEVAAAIASPPSTTRDPADQETANI